MYKDFLDMRDYLQKRQKEERKYFKVLLYGSPKIGKTTCLETCVKPILMDSFDPNGSLVLRDLEAKGELIVDRSFEYDDPDSPVAFNKWEESFKLRLSKDIFRHVGTYVIDSFSGWMDTLMYKVVASRVDIVKSRGSSFVKQSRISNDSVEQADYGLALQITQKYMRRFLALPCNCVLIGHEFIPDTKENFGEKINILSYKSVRHRIPAFFDEVYQLKLKLEGGGKYSRVFVTQIQDNLLAGSRLSTKKGLLNLEEPADFKHILKKCGLPTEDIVNEEPKIEPKGENK